MGEITELINKVDIFQSLSDNIKSKLEKIMEKRFIHEGEDIAVYGEQALFFFILISGRLMLSFKEGEAVILKEAGDLIAFELIASESVYTSSLKSLTQSEVFFMNHKKFLEIIQEDSSDFKNVMEQWKASLIKTVPFIEKLDFASAESI